MYYYGYPDQTEQQDPENLPGLKDNGPWIDPVEGLGDTVEMVFTRPVGSSGQYSTTMTNRKQTKVNETPVNETPAEE